MGAYLLNTYHFAYLQMVDPGGIANWSVTHVDWSEGKWHPRSYRAADVTYDLLKNITVCFCFVVCLFFPHKLITVHSHANLHYCCAGC